MLKHLCKAVSVVLIAGCAGATAGPIFEFSPAAGPLTYVVETTIDVLVETPMGDQKMETKTDVTVTLEVGEPLEDGWNFVGTFEALESVSEGGTGREIVTADGILGKPFAGVLYRNGVVEIDDSPVVPSRVANTVDPAAMFSELLPPLPPRNHPLTDPWQVSTSSTTKAGIEIVSELTGTGRMVRDTVWDGIPARIIVVSGEAEASGKGRPEGSPAEMEMVVAGPTERTYVWDPIRGVMLSARITNTSEGTVTIMAAGLSMAASLEYEQTVRLRR